MSLNNYYKILTRGSNYTISAAINWHKRKVAISNIWHRLEATEKKQRALVLLCKLNERLDKLDNLVENVKREQQQIAFEAQNQFIILECSNFLCQEGPGGFIMSVKADRFEEGSFHCGNCGHKMRIEGSAEIDEMLEKMGISIMDNGR